MSSNTNNRNNATSASPLSSLGEASGIAFLLSNHAIFGMAERCCYHFDLIETLTSLPLGRLQQQQSLRGSSRRERGLSISSHEGAANNNNNNSDNTKDEGKSKATTEKSSSKRKSSLDSTNATTKTSCICGVVSLLECVASGGDRATRRALRAKHREFNTRAQAAWGTRGNTNGNSNKKNSSSKKGGGGDGSNDPSQPKSIRQQKSGGSSKRCHQPRHLPLPLNPNTRVTFAYELTSIAIVVDASPSLTATASPPSSSFGSILHHNYYWGGSFVGSEEKSGNSSVTMEEDDGCCVPLDRLGKTLQKYLFGLIQPIDIPPVAVSGLGVAFGQWTPNLAVTVVAAYPPTAQGGEGSAGLLVRDYRVVNEDSVLELVRQVELWALREVEGTIAERLCGDGVNERDFGGNGQQGSGLSRLDSFSSLPVNDQALSSKSNVRSSVKELLAVGDAALSTLPSEGRPIILVASDCQTLDCTSTFEFLTATERTDVPFSVIDLSLNSCANYGSHSQLADICQLSGGIFLHRELLESCVKAKAGSAAKQKISVDMQQPPKSSALEHQSCFQGDIHFCSKKRSVKPNALQWYTLFILSPFTPGGIAVSAMHPMKFMSSSASTLSLTSLANSKQTLTMLPSDKRMSVDDSKLQDTSIFSPPSTATQERVMFSKYCIQPVRIKSLLMSRVLEGYRARKYGQSSQDSDKVSIHFTLRIAECDVALHYEVSFVSSAWHIPTIGTSHINISLSGENVDFIQTVKRIFMSNRSVEMVPNGKRLPAATLAAAERICKLLRWLRKEDYLDSYLCLPGWGDHDHLSPGSSFLRRIETLSGLQRHRHFRSETLEVVTTGGGNPYEKAESIFGDMEQNSGEKELFETLMSWSTEMVSEGEMYLKEITPAKEDDLAYYCIVRISQSTKVSRLFSVTVDFHGELDTEQRLAILMTLKESLRSCFELLLLDRGVSNYITLRPLLPSSVWKPSREEYFLHRKSWDLLKDPEVLPLLFKRRHVIGGFFILQADENRAVFCKFVKDESTQKTDMVLYQVLQRQDGIHVDIHMEACSAVFHPYRSKSSSLYALYERVRRRDKDCARNLRSRTNLLAALDTVDRIQSARSSQQEEDDVLRILKVSTPTIVKMRFFGDGSGSANDILSNLIAHHLVSSSFHTQTARLLPDKVGQLEGVFFIMKLDWYVLSVACLESRDRSEDEDEIQMTHRDLTFFTAGIIDLYQSDDETKVVNEEISPSEQFSETLPIDEIMAVHPKLYAVAMFKALRDGDCPVTSIQCDEVSYAMSEIHFEEVLHASIEIDDLTDQLSVVSETTTGQRLAQLISAILTPIPGGNDFLFFYNGALGDDLDNADKAGDYKATRGRNDEDESYDESYAFCEDFAQEDNQSICTEEERVDTDKILDNSPIYFQFTITNINGEDDEDERPVSLTNIRALKKSVILAAQVSVFDHVEKRALPFKHTQVIRKLQHALDEFASEQTLDRYRYIGLEALTNEDFKIVMRNLLRSKHHVLKVSLSFYGSRASSMISAFNPPGVNESDLEHGYDTLLSELESSELTTKASEDSFLFIHGGGSSAILLYWCFVQIKKSSGSVIVRVHHPHGPNAAQKHAEVAVSFVKNILIRTNQKLLLESMYKLRKAPKELFDDEEVDGPEFSSPASSRGNYACPVKYQHEFPLHRRVSPQQAVRTLHSSILQNFMLSNLNEVSVYRDESNNIFYMNLIYLKNIKVEDEENTHVIKLLVYGIDQPGPVITEELVRLLQRKLLMLPLDALSSVLNKNPQYNLLATDMSFINNFARRLNEIEPDTKSDLNICRRTYELPSHVEDPLTLLLMFRQNICGSTFIQLLHHETNEDDVQVSDILEVESKSTVVKRIPGSEFRFFFNSLGLGLDPTAQHVTTLTSQGRLYSRQAGSGLAVIQVNLLQGGTPASCISFGKSENRETTLRVSKEQISLNPVVDESKETYKLCVKVTNTTVDAEAIQKWVYLSLSQVLAAYTIERHRESCLQSTDDAVDVPITSGRKDREALNQLLPGLPRMEDMMKIAINLPHPAMMKVESKSRIKATSLAIVMLDLVEKAILSSVFNKSLRLPYEGVEIFRMASTASRVSITRDRIMRAKVVSLESGSLIKDNHVDSAEYICVFGLRKSDGNAMNSPHHLFFKEIHVARPETSVFTEALHRLKTLKPVQFERHMVFILRVSRTTRSLMTYNLSPHIWANMKTNFNDIENELSRAEEAQREQCVGRCIEQFPFTIKKRHVVATVSNTAKAPEPQRKEQISQEEQPTVANKGPARRIKRPTSMLRPKLIGKSVDGAAAQAVQASRLRAKTRPSVPQRQRAGPASKASLSAPATQKKQTKEKSVQQKQRREAAQRDTLSRSIVQSVPSTNLLKFHRDLTALLKEAAESQLFKPTLCQSVLQLIIHIYFGAIKERHSPLMLTRLISHCYGFQIGCQSISHLRSDTEFSSMRLFLHYIARKWGASVMKTSYPHFHHFLQKDILSSTRRRVIIFLEILINWDRVAKCFIFYQKVWLMNSSDNLKNSSRLSRKNAEQEAAVIDAVTQDFMSHLALGSEVLNFAGSRLTKAAKEQDTELNTLALLRSTVERFSDKKQLQYCLEGSATYLLQRRFLAPSSILSKELCENYNRSKLFQHFSLNGKAHNIINCSGSGGSVFACTMLKIAGFCCRIFVAAHESVETALDVFILCMTRGERVDTYVAIEGTPFAERICDVLLEHSMSAVEELITAACSKMRTVHLWRRLGSDYVPKSTVSVELMDELRQCCRQIDMLDVEPRLQSLLAEEANELQIPWEEVFRSFDRSPQFHCIRIDRGGDTNWVVYSRECDIFIDIVSEPASSTANYFRRTQLLLLLDENDRGQSIANASNIFISFVLNWILDDCYIGM